MHFKRYHNAESGFTLIELMATLVILTLITVIAIPTIGTIIETAAVKSEQRSVDLIEHAAGTADAAGLQHDREGQYDVMSLMDKGYLDFSWDSDLVEPTSYVQKEGNTYVYYGKGSYGNADEVGDVNYHDLFDIQSFVRHDELTDGVGPFDDEDRPGLDHNNQNGIVRTWDTAVYPINVTVNSKSSKVARNIKVKLSGTLENGITGGNRINARFAVGGTESLETNTVAFEQEYTIPRTGNSVKVPITVEVLGAPDGLELRPDIKVEVLSVDGTDISDAEIGTHFDTLPAVTTSAQVSIKPHLGGGLTGQGIHHYPYGGITGDIDEPMNMSSYSLSWGVKPLGDDKSVKGATFPDPDSEIIYDITMSGRTYWSDRRSTTYHDYSGKDTPHLLLDHRPISTNTKAVGSPNTLLEGENYTFKHSNRHVGPRSQTSSLDITQTRHSVWDSGDWSVGAPVIDDSTAKYAGGNTGFVIGSTFPEYRSDGYTGSKVFDNRYEKIFSSRAFLTIMPNEYGFGRPNNPDNEPNTTYYSTKVEYKGYVDENGAFQALETPITATRTATESNDPGGNSFSVQNSFFAQPPMRQTGTPNIGNGTVSKADASIVAGEDVAFTGYSLNRLSLPGGYQNVLRWNTDAFEMTEEYAAQTESHMMASGYQNALLETVRRDTENHKVRYGVARFTDNSFESFTKKGRDDYDWYDSFDEAISHGEIGAVMNDIHANAGAKTTPGSRALLRVKHENIGIGSETKDGTPLIGVTNFYAYLDKEREIEIDASEGRTYNNPSEWNDKGEFIKPKSPWGSLVNFETIGVTPADTLSTMSSDKGTYYNTDVITWRHKGAVRIKDTSVLDDFGREITIKHTLPEGLDYAPGSGSVGSLVTEPEVKNLGEGKTELIWETELNDIDRIPDVTFKTGINPSAIGESTTTSSVSVTSTIESKLDYRPIKLRSDTLSVSILKVGSVGIYETIDEAVGPVDSTFNLTLSPYSMLTSERGVVGITTIPQNGDKYGSKFSGTTAIETLNVELDRKHKDASVELYLNDEAIYDDRPHNINELGEGWREYTGDEDQLENAKSILFKVNGLLSSGDDIKINVGVKTEGNAAGDVYYNETLINSMVNYTLSPVSHRVGYTIE